MLIRIDEIFRRKDEKTVVVLLSKGYRFLRKAQKNLMMGEFIRSFREISERDVFRFFARKLTEKFFPKTVEKGASEVKSLVERAYVDWLILAPLTAHWKWLPKPGMHRGHYLTWARRNCNKQTRQYFFARLEFPLQDADDMAERAVENAVSFRRLKDKEWLKEEFGFLSWLSTTDGLKARLARWILLPWVFLDEDFKYDEILHHSIPGREKEIARAGKRGSASYFRLGNEVWIFATRRIAEKVDLPWRDLREEKARALDYWFWYEEKGVRVKGKKKTTAGLRIELDSEVLRHYKEEAKAIVHKDVNYPYRLYLLNELAKDFITTHRHAITAGPQFSAFGGILRELVRRKIAPTLGPEIVQKGIYPSYGDIDNRLYFMRLNPFWDTSQPDEGVFLEWWNPYQP